jgi:hypothetical protein
VSHAPASRPMRIVLLATLTAGYFLAVYVFFRPVQLRIWNEFSAIDVFIMACLILPFMVVPLLVRPRQRVTRYAWGVSAVIALDLVFFAVAEFGPLGSGHPSLESLASYFLALAKPVLVPLALALLGVACVKGERMALVATGFLCLAGETLYGTYPTAWWGTA